ncbi:hypothetical protein GUITHDRAFT_143104 [Guillardia theta CCMP2712]|uniref:Uncharacterized protein n=1 Tax=Guillardia theta (strain CCMP2712) TaxID=905079 RepID=L1IVL7_GUITC|nr:hypothetical protein GUITHDRAFT_143104 [Guillardia theta CCMP2712]EKX39939.1 hypothetical protein GUITHDRAFT_143104 [Guillardia theta CCMP2712]|eukprot:XP_005826919.1 hypothetical protein GUITHDRAFT_143104 [Guillardia theta CCMP2712]
MSELGDRVMAVVVSDGGDIEVDKAQRRKQRRESLWSGEGFIPFHLLLKPSHTKLDVTRSNVRVEDVKMSLFKKTTHIDNIDVSYIENINRTTVIPGCFSAKRNLINFKDTKAHKDYSIRVKTDEDAQRLEEMLLQIMEDEQSRSKFRD